MIKEYHLVLVEKIHEWEEKGWKLVNNRVHVAIGGWASVYMVRECDD